MLVKLVDVEITKDLIKEGLKWRDRNVALKNAINKKKYTVLDWRDLKDFDFSLLDEEDLWDFNYLDINNIELVYKFFNFIDQDEELLWNFLVDDHIISHELYMKNTHRENFDILMKMSEFTLPL